MNKLKEDYLIRIKSRTEHEDLPDMVELTTRGSFVHKNGSFFITYRDTETTGYAGCTTTLKVAEDASRVAMLRYGPAATHFLIEKGRRNVCHYETGYGSITRGVSADEISQDLTDRGGHLCLAYVLDADGPDLLSRISLDVTVARLN